MKYFKIFEIEPSNLCEWVKEKTEKGESEPDLIVNAYDLDSGSDYIRIAEVCDDEKVRIIIDECTPIDMEEWVAFDSLHYDNELGLMW